MRPCRQLLLAAHLGLACLAGLAASEIFTSSAQMQAVMELERGIADTLSTFLTRMETKLELIRKYLQEYDQIRAEAADSTDQLVERVVGNPLHTFHTLKRLTVDWRQLEQEWATDDWQGVLHKLDALRAGHSLPGEEDLHGAAQAIVRLQDVYDLNVTDLSAGQVWGRQTTADMSAWDCCLVGNVASGDGFHTSALQWLDRALTLAREREAAHFIDKVHGYREKAMALHDETLSLGHTGPYLLPAPVAQRPAQQQLQERRRRRPRRYSLGPGTTEQDDGANWSALCRGEKLLPAEEETRLCCWSDDRGDSYYYLQPAHLEQLHRNPPVILLHDVISDREISVIMDLARPQLARSLVVGTSASGEEVSSTRTSKTAWLADSLHPLLARIRARVSWLTGLQTSSDDGAAEQLQVLNYGIGGHYNPHLDYLNQASPGDHEQQLPPEKLKMGDRVATFMFYFSDVIKGGATAFPRLGVATWPKKGSAVFWYNLRKNGDGNRLSLHGACPVLYGSKWVGNLWMRELAQLHSRPCSRDKDE